MERNRAQLFWAACLFGAIAAVSAAGAFAAVKDFANARASGNWMQVEGVVLSPKEDAGAARLFAWRPGLRYAYHFRGETHEGRRFAFLTRGKIGSPPSTKPGARVIVYVSPDDPKLSVLVPGGSGRRFAIWFAAAGAVAFVGVGGLIRSMMAVDFPEFDARAGYPSGWSGPDSDPRAVHRHGADGAPLVDRYYHGENKHYPDPEAEAGDADEYYDDPEGAYDTASFNDGRAISTW